MRGVTRRQLAGSRGRGWCMGSVRRCRLINTYTVDACFGTQTHDTSHALHRSTTARCMHAALDRTMQQRLMRRLIAGCSLQCASATRQVRLARRDRSSTQSSTLCVLSAPPNHAPAPLCSDNSLWAHALPKRYPAHLPPDNRTNHNPNLPGLLNLARYPTTTRAS